jgi:hypothetical protein
MAGGLEGPEQEPRQDLRGAVRDLPGHPLVVCDDAPDVIAGEFGCDVGDVAERHRGIRGERDRAVEGPLAGEDHGGRLRFVAAVGPGHGPVGRCRDDAGLAPWSEQPVQGVGELRGAQAPVGADADPVQGLRAGWELHVGFGLANPELFRLMHTACTPDGQAAAAAGIQMLQARLHRVAAAGRLRVTERRAAGLIHAAGTGVVFTLIDQAEDERDQTLADTAWEAVCAAILTDASTAAITGPAAAAVTLRAALPGLTALTAAERALLGDWLDRIADSERAPR